MATALASNLLVQQSKTKKCIGMKKASIADGVNPRGEDDLLGNSQW